MFNKLRSQFSSNKMNVPDDFKDYQKSRSIKNKQYICHAPFNSLYFNVSGQAAPCWLTLDQQDSYPEKSIREIWNSQKLQSIRRGIQHFELNKHCSTCLKNINNHNFETVLSKLYDNDYPLSDYPTIIEFELSNTCNLECIMCKGELSSSIRKNREQLPPLSTPYDYEFVRQLKEFIPHLKEAKFLGGEPFLIDIYFDIWEQMIEINPEIQITITTNGNVYNERVKRVLNHLKCHLIVSIDSVVEETYEKIRLRGNFQKLMNNFNQLANHAKAHHTYLGVSSNPMRSNWKEIPLMVYFCNQNEVQLWLNTVIYPFEQSMWKMSADELQSAYLYLSSIDFESSNPIHHKNILHFKNFVENQVKVWSREARLEENRRIEFVTTHTFDEVYSAMEQLLMAYFDEDNYLTIGRKSVLKETYLKQLELYINEGQYSISHLYSMPISDILQQLLPKKIVS
ncbi:MAG: radical SAM protein [Chitinophagales bacterium]|nr:radical SAM protein [Chitinophagales bacterium]